MGGVKTENREQRTENREQRTRDQGNKKAGTLRLRSVQASGPGEQGPSGAVLGWLAIIGSVRGSVIMGLLCAKSCSLSENGSDGDSES